MRPEADAERLMTWCPNQINSMGASAPGGPASSQSPVMRRSLSFCALRMMKPHGSGPESANPTG